MIVSRVGSDSMRQDDGDTELLGGQLCSFDASEIREVSIHDVFGKFCLLRVAIFIGILIAFARM